MMMKIKKHKKIFSCVGFTTIELTIVISIFAILSGVVLFNSNAFSSKVSFENLTSDIAINILQAQKEAMSGKINSLTFGSNSPSYGMHFSTTTNKTFTYFADLPSPRDYMYNFNYSCSSSPECLNEINIQTDAVVSALCINQKSNQQPTCLNSVTDLDIVFTRPLPGPRFSTIPLFASPILDVEIEVTSLKTNSKKTIIVWHTGQISVE